MNLFNHIKSHLSILSVISEHVSLKKAGLYWKASCPFHGEKTASFTVSPHKEIFYCFGCHASGDAITFISMIEHCSLLESAYILAERYAIDIPQNDSFPKQITPSLDEKKRHYELNTLIAQWCNKNLLQNNTILHYIYSRGFSDATIKKFNLGYMPSGQISIKELITYIQQYSFLAKELIDQQFIITNKIGYYSPFEDRLIFPIKDHLGRLCGFGGRITSTTDERPKYYNSHDASYFQKGNLLYGLDLAKKEIQKTGIVFLVEGYTDCIAMVQNKYNNTVATLGTACTVEHLTLLSHHAEKLYIMYDADTAGQKAMLRLAELCWNVNIEPYIISLPSQYDPASFLLSQENDLSLLIDNARTIFIFFLETISTDFAENSMQKQLELIRSFLSLIKKINDPLKQDILLQKASLQFSLPFESLKQEMQKLSTILSTTTEKLNILNIDPDKSEPFINIPTLEKKFLCAILHNMQLLTKTEVLRVIDHLPEPVFSIIKIIHETYINNKNESETLSILTHTVESKLQQLILKLLVSNTSETISNEDFETILFSLEKKYWKLIINNTKLKLTIAQKNNDKNMVNTLINDFLILKEKLLRKGLN